MPALKAANGLPIVTYGRCTIDIRVGTNNHIKLDCWVAEVKNPILGWDWMANNAMEICLRHVRGDGRKYFLTINGKKVNLSMAKSKADVGVHAVSAVSVATAGPAPVAVTGDSY